MQLVVRPLLSFYPNDLETKVNVNIITETAANFYWIMQNFSLI